MLLEAFPRPQHCLLVGWRLRENFTELQWLPMDTLLKSSFCMRSDPESDEPQAAQPGPGRRSHAPRREPRFQMTNLLESTGWQVKQ